MPKWLINVTGLSLMWIALFIGAASLSLAGESRWTRLKQYWGAVMAIKIDKCGYRPGLCEGVIVLGQRDHSEVVLAIRPGTWIKRGERLVLMEELRVGEEIHVQAFEVEGDKRLRSTMIDILTPN
jgi:hypothetical protein